MSTKAYNLRDLTEHGVLMDHSKNIINDNFRKLFKSIQQSESDVKTIEYNPTSQTLTIEYFDAPQVVINLSSSGVEWEPLRNH